jgi:DNA-binding CsgD family transcriptional regulator
MSRGRALVEAPPSTVVAGPAADAVVALASGADWKPTNLEAIPAAPFALHDARFLCRLQAHHDPAAIVRLAVRGVAIVLVASEDPIGEPAAETQPASRVIDGLARTSRCLPLADHPAVRLTPTEIGLVLALGEGTTTESAARGQHVSVRSAHRHLRHARETVGVATTSELIEIVLDAHRAWSR